MSVWRSVWFWRYVLHVAGLVTRGRIGENRLVVKSIEESMKRESVVIRGIGTVQIASAWC